MEQPVGLAALPSADWRRKVHRRRANIAQHIAGHREVALFGAGCLGRHVLRDADGLRFKAETFVDKDSTL